MMPPAPVAPPPPGAPQGPPDRSVPPPPPTTASAAAPAPTGPPPAPQLTPAPAPTSDDPHAVGACVGRLGFSAKRNARVSAGIVTALLDDGEHAQQLVQGSFLGKHAVAVLTDRRLLIVNDREWKPDVRSMALRSDLTVEGMGDDRTASLTFRCGGEIVEVSGIGDPSQARELAHRIRTAVAEG
jgi:hypothetical protein